MAAAAPANYTPAALGVALVAFAARLIWVILAPERTGDASTYIAVAENILGNGCVSLSDPVSSACVPHWGGNQFPGYPAFMALVWTLARGETAVLIAQSVVGAAAAAALALAAARWSGSSRAGLAVGLVAALSPLQIGWPRLLLTETLALAASAWVFAEILLSVHDRRLRTVRLGAALAIAAFLRYDSVFLAIPVLIAAFAIHRPGEAVRRLAVVAVVAALPIAAWTARSVSAGLPFPPSFATYPDGSPTPAGYFRWVNTWVTDQYHLPGLFYPLVAKRYDDLRLPPDRPADAAERADAARLYERLGTHAGQAFPTDIEAAFGALADARTAQSPLQVWVVVPAQRALQMWLTPFASFGLPLSVPDDARDRIRSALASRDVGAFAALALDFGPLALGKIGVASYRYLLLAGFVLALGAALRRPSPATTILVVAASVALARTMFFAQTITFESRYMVEAIPFMEAALALYVFGRRNGVTSRTRHRTSQGSRRRQKGNE